MPHPVLARRAALRFCLALSATAALPAALAGCGGEAPAPEVFAPLDFSYLTKLRLNVASLEIDDTWTPPADSGQHVEYLSPVQPIDALRQMAQQRLVAAGSSGRARFVIEDASILQGPGRLDGSFAVRLDVSTSDGASSGFAEARVARSQPLNPDDADGGRATAYALTRNMMDAMNVEFEYQVRRSLQDYLQATAGSAPLPPAVQSQPLPPPGTVSPLPPLPPPATYAPTPAPTFAPTLAPPGS